jgi:hypothetical protein
LDWVKSLSQEKIEEAIAMFLQAFNGSFRDVVQRFLIDAPRSVREECTTMIAKRQYRRCLEKSLMWAQGSEIDRVSEGFFVYFPDGLLELVVQGAVGRVHDETDIHPPDFVSNKNEGGQFFAAGYGIGMGDAKNSSAENNSDNPSEILSSAEHWGYAGHANDECSEKFDRVNTGAVSNKKRRAGVSGPDYYDPFSEASVDCGFRDKRRRDESASILSADLQESAAFSKKLEDLLQGRTVDLPVGNASLSRLLRDVPSINLDTR